jgi:hypothetical protein
MVCDALQGQRVYEIAQAHGIAESTVWRILSNTVRDLAGQPARQPGETAGWGSDIDPGILYLCPQIQRGNVEQQNSPG